MTQGRLAAKAAGRRSFPGDERTTGRTSVFPTARPTKWDTPSPFPAGRATVQVYTPPADQGTRRCAALLCTPPRAGHALLATSRCAIGQRQHHPRLRRLQCPRRCLCPKGSICPPACTRPLPLASRSSTTASPPSPGRLDARSALTSPPSVTPRQTRHPYPRRQPRHRRKQRWRLRRLGQPRQHSLRRARTDLLRLATRRGRNTSTSSSSTVPRCRQSLRSHSAVHRQVPPHGSAHHLPRPLLAAERFPPLPLLDLSPNRRLEPRRKVVESDLPRSRLTCLPPRQLRREPRRTQTNLEPW